MLTFNLNRMKNDSKLYDADHEQDDKAGMQITVNKRRPTQSTHD